ncbi:MAG: hypothetical protein K8R23_08990 [Chthoniobacter sp.]|nr:hypothetical protein [Chthoniobacter sp.]
MTNKHVLAAATALTLTFVQITAPAVCAGERSPVDSKKAVIPPEPVDHWQFMLAMPGWLAATSGTIGVDGINSHVYLGADTLIRHLDMIASFSAEARKGRFGIYGDLLYVSASDGIGTNGLIEKVDFRLDQYLIDMELNYRVLEGPSGFLDLRAGVRYTNLYNKLTISPNDEAIDRASASLVEEAGRLVRQRLSALDLAGRLRGALKQRVTDKLEGLRGERPALPIAPIGGGRPGRVDELIRAIIDRRAESFAAALRAEAAAATAQLRTAAQQRVNAVKNRISKEIASTLKRELDNSFSLAEDWWDPYVGLRGRYNINKAWYLTAKGDIGGFGVGSDLTWQLSGALGVQVTRSLFVEAGYRYLYTDYNKDNFVYEVTQSGVEITAGITF